MKLATRMALHHALWNSVRVCHNSILEQERRLKENRKKRNESRSNNSKDSANS
jgi:hypothetical protein